MKKMNWMTLGLMLILSASAQAAIPQADDQNFSSQYAIASDANLPMSQRWKALLKASELAEGPQLEKVMAFAGNKDWYMHNATLVALDKMGTDLVYDKAKILVRDKALVVRSAAADILMRLNSREVRKIFSEEIAKPYNFNGKSSLWIRSQMMRHLVQNPTAEERPFFAHYLFDTDKQIADMSSTALEKMTSIRFEGKDKLAQWKKLARERRWF